MLTLSWTTWVEGTITVLTVVHHTILIAKTSWRNKQFIEELDEAHKPLRMSLFRVVLMVLSCNLLWNVINFVIILFELNHHIFGCWFFYGIIMTIYYIGKCCIWYYNVLRLEMVFRGAPQLNYHPTLLKSLKIAFVITAVLLSAACIAGMGPSYQNSEGRCVLLFELWANATIILPDTFLSCLCYWLFHRKMKLLTKVYQSTMNKSVNETGPKSGLDSQLLYVLRKFTILCAATIISTWIAGGIAIVFPSMAMVMGSVDSVINVWCILLYDRRYDSLYLKVFGCLAKPEWAIVSPIQMTNQTSEKTSTDHAKSAQSTDVEVTDAKSKTVQMIIS